MVIFSVFFDILFNVIFNSLSISGSSCRLLFMRMMSTKRRWFKYSAAIPISFVYHFSFVLEN